MDKAKICLVTGGCGFLGSHIVRRLVKENYYVRVLDKSEKPQLGPPFPQDQVEVVIGETGNPRLIRKCLRNVNCLFIFSNSYLPSDMGIPQLSKVAATLAIDVGILAQAVQSGVEKIIFPSSGGAIYGIPRQIPIPESHPTDPISAYGIVKLATEKYLALFERQYGVRCIALRYGNPFGVYQNPLRGFGVLTTFLYNLAAGKPLTVFGDGSVTRDFIYIDDVVEATFQAIQYSGVARVFNVGSGIGFSVTELVDLTQKITGRQGRIVFLPSRSSDVPKITLDSTLAKREFNWDPKISIEDGISRTWTWVQEFANYGK